MDGKINLGDLLYLLRKNIGWIIAFSIIGAVAAMTVSMLFIRDKYTATCQLYVNNLSEANPVGQLTYTDLNASIRMLNTSIAILGSEPTLEEVNSKLNKPIGVSALRGSLTLSSEKDATIIRISCTTENPALSAEICNKVAEVAPGALYNVYEGGSAKRIDTALEPKSPSSPNVPKNTMFGGAVGVFASFAVILCYFLFDSTVKGEEDIRHLFDVPVLGEIPSFGKNTKRRAQ